MNDNSIYTNSMLRIGLFVINQIKTALVSRNNIHAQTLSVKRQSTKYSCFSMIIQHSWIDLTIHHGLITTHAHYLLNVLIIHLRNLVSISDI